MSSLEMFKLPGKRHTPNWSHFCALVPTAPSAGMPFWLRFAWLTTPYPLQLSSKLILSRETLLRAGLGAPSLFPKRALELRFPTCGPTGLCALTLKALGPGSCHA